MNYTNVAIESFGYAAPPEVWSSLKIEEALGPLYDRLGLVPGRLELMSGIRERRFWKEGTLPSQAAALAGADALRKAGGAAEDLDCLINCSVSRDCVEPATSTAVHHLLGCGHDCMNFDISNACLGMGTGLLMLANMIELGQIRRGMVVSGENAGPLVKNTIDRMNRDLSLTRRSIKDQFASLTIGSCATAIIAGRKKDNADAHLLRAAASYTDTEASSLCRGDAAGGMTEGAAPLMSTDSHALLMSGVAAARQMWERLKISSGWDEESPDLICTHQVGKAHSALLFQTLRLDQKKDFTTFETFGNCGSSSWPLTCSRAEESGRLLPGMKLAVLAIGSGINCTGLSLEW